MKWEHQVLSIEDSDSYEDIAEKIIQYAHDLWGTDTMRVVNFGKSKDLELVIRKDEAYNPAEDEEEWDLVDITIYKNESPVTDALGVYVTGGELESELNYAYHIAEEETLEK